MFKPSICAILYQFALLYIGFVSCHDDWVEHKGLLYHISKQKNVMYAAANSKCEDMNGHLAVITNKDQNEYLASQVLDGHKKWIGLSSNKTKNHGGHCNAAQLVWNYDIVCQNEFSSLTSGAQKNFIPNCSGVTFHNGVWDIQNCSEQCGFICQWECKRFHFHSDNAHINGTYALKQYYNGNVLYQNLQNKQIQIYKTISRQRWVVTWDDTYLASYKSERYVPYLSSIISNETCKTSINSSYFSTDIKGKSDDFVDTNVWSNKIGNDIPTRQIIVTQSIVSKISVNDTAANYTVKPKYPGKNYTTIIIAAVIAVTIVIGVIILICTVRRKQQDKMEHNESSKAGCDISTNSLGNNGYLESKGKHTDRSGIGATDPYITDYSYADSTSLHNQKTILKEQRETQAQSKHTGMARHIYTEHSNVD